MSKVVSSSQKAICGIISESTIMIGGFGVCGIPQNAINAIMQTPITNLTVISNSAGLPDYGLGLLIGAGKVKKVICSYIGENEQLEQMILNEEIEMEMMPQGTIAMKCMLNAYSIGAAYFSAGIGTEIAEGKEIREINSKPYLLEETFNADFALIKAWKADKNGNLLFKATARNFNPCMGMGAKYTIAEVEEIVDYIDENEAHLDGKYVHKIFQGEEKKKRILYLTNREKNNRSTD